MNIKLSVFAAAIGLISAVSAADGWPGGGAIPNEYFIGLWGGIDPMDGGYAQRSITLNADQTFALIGRDTYHTLCEGSDEGVAFATGIREEAAMMADVVLTCFNNGKSVDLRAEYSPDPGNRTLVELIRNRAGQTVTSIVLHRLSR